MRLARRFMFEAPAWTPASLPGLEAWYRADLGVTESGGAVSAWADQSGNGRTLSQASGTAQPTLNASDALFGGQPSIQFDGSSDRLKTALWSPAPSGPVTLYAAFQASPTTSNLWLADSISNTAGAVVGLTIGVVSAGSTFNLRLQSAGGSSTITVSPLAMAAAHVVCGIMRGDATSQLFVDSLTGTTGNAGTSTTTNGLTLGARLFDSAFAPCRFAEWILYSGAHDATARQQVMQYLGARHGVTVSP